MQVTCWFRRPTSTFLIATVLMGCGASTVQKQDREYTKQEVVDQMEADLKRNMAEVDADPKLSPKEKEATKKMMQETVRERSKTFRE
jgi:hypothetical protein